MNNLPPTPTPPVAPFRNGKFPSSPSLPLGCLEDRDPTLLGSLVCHNVHSGMHVSYSDALRVPVPPSAKLNLLSPPSSARRVGPPSRRHLKHSLCEHQAAGRGRRSKTAAPQSPVQLPCYCPLIHCSEGEESGGSKKSCEHSTSKIS